MELYQLEYFAALCESRNYRKASERLMVTQPAVSIAIKKLEGELGGELVDRKKKSFTLTPMGKALQKRANLICNEIQYTHKEMSAILKRQQGIIQLALPCDVCPGLLEALMSEYVSKNPEVPLILSKKPHETIVDNLANQIIDIGVVGKDFVAPSWGSRDFKQVELYACFSPAHSFNQYEYITPRMLRDENLILSKDGNSLSNTVRKYLSYNNVQVNSPLYCEGDIPAADAVLLAQKGFGIAFIESELSNGHCRPLFPMLVLDLVITWRIGRTITPGIIELKKCLIDFILNLV